MMILSNQQQAPTEEESNINKNSEKRTEENNLNGGEENLADGNHTEPIGVENQQEMSTKEYELLKQKLVQSPTI